MSSPQSLYRTAKPRRSSKVHIGNGVVCWKVRVRIPCSVQTRWSTFHAAPECFASKAKLAEPGPTIPDSNKQGRNFVYQLAFASAAVPAAPATALENVSFVPEAPRAGGWVAPLSNAMEQVLYVFRDALDELHVPYAYGYSIILLTLVVKILTYPLVKQQVESALAVQALKPRVDLIKDRFGDDTEKIRKETSVLYEQAGVNPLAGCLPTLATIPVFIGLYTSLTNVANGGLLDTQGFYWIPSLAGPTTLAQRQSGLGTSWLFPFVDGAPPIGWGAAATYLVLPVLLVLVQYVSSYLTNPPIDPNDENASMQRILLLGLPLMIGWFALNVPSGLSLYYLSNTVLSAAQQVYLKKLGGARVSINELGPIMKPGSGRRSGIIATDVNPWMPATVPVAAVAAETFSNVEATVGVVLEATDKASFGSSSNTLSTATPSAVSRQCKRRRLSSLVQDGTSGV
uniref:ALB3_1m n=1 Tax=Volvox carteri f. nagariensis TaxID=3068 RepID=D9CJ77_VOLCA|nr:ALB3_1m [Volvox carteri f. nagariensis]